MAITDAFPGPSGITDATELRKDLAGLIVRDVNGNARPGVFFRNTTPFVTGRSDMKYDVGIFHGASVRGGGPLFQANDGVQTISTTTAPLSNQRYDIIYFKQNENAAPYADADAQAQLAVYQGATAASPDLPTALAALASAKPGAVPLYSALIPSTATGTNSAGVVIKEICDFTATTGGVVPFRTLPEMKLWTTAVQGQRARIIGSKGQWEWDGAAWVPMFNVRLRYSTIENINNADVTTPMVGTPVIQPDSSAFSAEFLTPIAGGWTVVKSGQYTMGSPVYMDIAGGKVALDKRGFVELRVNGAMICRATTYSGPSEDQGEITFPPFVLTAGQTVSLKFYQTTGTTVTMDFWPTFEYLGPAI